MLSNMNTYRQHITYVRLVFLQFRDVYRWLEATLAPLLFVYKEKLVDSRIKRFRSTAENVSAAVFEIAFLLRKDWITRIWLTVFHNCLMILQNRFTRWQLLPASPLDM